MYVSAKLRADGTSRKPQPLAAATRPRACSSVSVDGIAAGAASIASSAVRSASVRVTGRSSCSPAAAGGNSRHP